MRRLAVAVTALAFVVGCGEESQAPSSSDSSREQELQQRIEDLEAQERERQQADARERSRERQEDARERQALQAAAREEPTTEPGSSDGGELVVPNVVGLDHQAAQDALQGEGLYVLDEEDCTGQGRLLLFDRNWEVVSTDPPAGTSVGPDTTITLCSKKQGE